jgi:hypothetical protein
MQAAGYSLMFNVETVAQGLRYGVTVRDHKTMLKVLMSMFSNVQTPQVFS